jgi:hypothetical protein
LAADLPAPVAPYAPPLPPRAYNWTSVYIGGNAGYGFATASETASLFGFSVTSSEDLTGFIGGGQVGANYQSGPVVFGIEGDLDASNQTHNATFGFATATDKITWVGTVRGRIGGAWDRVLVYGTAGWGEGKFTSNVTVPGFGTFDGSRTHGRSYRAKLWPNSQHHKRVISLVSVLDATVARLCSGSSFSIYPKPVCTASDLSILRGEVWIQSCRLSHFRIFDLILDIQHQHPFLGHRLQHIEISHFGFDSVGIGETHDDVVPVADHCEFSHGSSQMSSFSTLQPFRLCDAASRKALLRLSSSGGMVDALAFRTAAPCIAFKSFGPGLTFTPPVGRSISSSEVEINGRLLAHGTLDSAVPHHPSAKCILDAADQHQHGVVVRQNGSGASDLRNMFRIWGRHACMRADGHGFDLELISTTHRRIRPISGDRSH